MTRLFGLSLARTLALVAGLFAAGVGAEASFPGDNGQIVVARPSLPLAVLDPDGSDLRPLHADSTGATFPRWSPEGNRIAVVLNGDLVLLRPSGQLLRARTNHGAVVGAPSWSPDGTQLAYVRANGELWVVSTTGGLNGAAVPGPTGVTSAVWSPYSASGRIAYTDGGAILQIPPDGGTAEEIVPADSQGRTRSELSWHPHGVWLVFTSTATDGTTWIESQAGTFLVEPNDRSGVWSPDSRDNDRMLFTRNGVLSLFEINGGQVTSLGVSGLTPDWQPRLVASAALYETNTGTSLSFQVRAPSEIGTTVSYATTFGSATDGTDFQGTSGSLVAGTDPFGYLASFDVSITGDTDPEEDESFYVDFTFPSDPAAPLRVRGTILDDDGATATNGLIAYTSNNGAAVLDPIHGESALLFPAPASVPVYSPAGDRVAYVGLSASGDSQIVIADVDGNTLTTLTATVDEEIQWSPDGASIAWTDGGTLKVADSAHAGSTVTILSDAWTPSWSSDTVAPRRLAFARRNTGVVCTIREDGSALTCPTMGYQPRWSPDNSTIAFLRANVSVFLMNPDGSNQRFVTFLMGTTSGGPVLRWSPRDGFLGLMTGDTLIVRQESGPQTTVAGLPPTLRDFDWSPDGRRLVVMGTAPGMPHDELWVVGPNEAGAPLLTVEQVTGPGNGLGSAFAPRWGSARPRPMANLSPRGGIENFGQARVEVELSAPPLEAVTLGWQTLDVGSATAGVDFVPVTSGTVTFAPGQTQAPILVTLLDDALSEGYEFFHVMLTTASGARLGPLSHVSVAITDDEPPPDMPVAQDGSASTAMDTPVTITLVATDPDGDPLTYSIVAPPLHGAVFGPMGNSVSYAPDAGYSGPDSFTFKANDGQSDSNVATVSVTVRGPNGPPVAVTDVAATPLDTAVDIDVLANDTDADGDTLTLTAVGTPAHGTATFAGGVVTYTPQAGFGSVDHFFYTISDGNGHTATGVVSVYVDSAPPPPPVLTVSPAFLDFGQVPLNKTRDRVLTVTNNTGAPVALFENFPILQDNPQPFDSFDFGSLDCRTVQARILDPGESCTQRVRFWAVPGADAASPATLRLLDGDSFDTIATVPLFASLGPADTGPNAPPVAVDDLAGVAPGFTHYLIPLWNDSDPDDDLLRIVAIADPPHGTVVPTAISCGILGLNPNADCIQYVPDTGYLGPDGIVYTVSDGRGGTAQATYHLAVGNLVPVVASITPDSGPIAGGQTVRITGSNFVYRADVTFDCGGVFLPLTVTQINDTEIFAVTPAGFGAALCNLRVRNLIGVSVGVLPNAYRYVATGAAPVAQDSSVSTNEDTPAATTLVATDADGDPLTYAIVTVPAHGTLTGTAPSLTYTPVAHYNGPDSFTFKANDGSADSNVATVSITVNPVNDPPVAFGQTVVTDEDTAKAITLVATDVEGSPLTFAIVTVPAHGTLTGTAPNLTYTPVAHYNGPDSFTFKANDGSADSNVATVSITVNPVNDPPVAFGQTVVTDQDTAAAIGLVATDVEGSPLTYPIVTGPAHGTLSGTAPNLTYTPAAGYNGPDGFTFTANDGAADSNVASVLIQVNAVPPACETNTGTVPSPGFLTTDTEADGATPGDPIETILITPVGGAVSIQECRIPQPAPTAFTFLDVQAQVTASPGTAAQPMTLVFVLDASILPPGTTAANAVVFRNGVHLAPCAAGTAAAPDPCVANRVMANGDLLIVARTSRDGLWTFGVPRSTSGQAVSGPGPLQSQSGAAAAFTASTIGGQPAGSLIFADGSDVLVANAISAFAVNADGHSAWFAGVGLGGRSFLAFVDDGGATGDVFRLWINGVERTGDGTLTSGNVTVVP